MKMAPAYNFVAMLEKGFFFLVKTFHLFNDRSSLGFQCLPNWSRKSVTNELFHELCKITSILLVQLITYFFNHESLTLLTIYKTWWNEKILTVRSYLFLTFFSSCHRIPVVVATDRAYENARPGWTLLFTTSLAAYNYLKISPLKTYARKLSLQQFIFYDFRWAEEPTSRYYEPTSRYCCDHIIPTTSRA